MTRKLEGIIGTRFTNRHGEVAEVVHYTDSKDVSVKFLDSGHVCTKCMTHLRSGKFTSPYTRTIYGVGYDGEGSFRQSEHRSIAARWALMLGRCYDKVMQSKNPTYIGCSVSEEWHSFQNYAKWFTENQYNNYKWEVDKDLKMAGNKVYSASTCAFVPPEINSFTHYKEGGEIPVGVSYYPANGKFLARCKQGNGSEGSYLGYYDTVEEALEVYAIAKEAYAKVLAERYKSSIDAGVYGGLMNFKVTA